MSKSNLKKRIIGCVIVKGGIAVQSIGFKNYLPIGSVAVAVEFLNKWGIDEIAIIDIDVTASDKRPNFELIKHASAKSFSPLTVGGGISSIEDMHQLNHFGAEKVMINNLALQNPEIIKKASKIFGAQFVMVSIDVKKNDQGKYEVYGQGGKESTGLDPVELARKVESLGAGEIFLNSIDQDGSKQGYDLKIIDQVAKAVNIPVIACGGAGHPEHFVKVLKETSASAVAAGNYWQFTEHSPIITKSYLKQGGIDVRLDTYVTYQDFNFDQDGRASKRSDEELEKLRFEYLPDEII